MIQRYFWLVTKTGEIIKPAFGQKQGREIDSSQEIAWGCCTLIRGWTEYFSFKFWSCHSSNSETLASSSAEVGAFYHFCDKKSWHEQLKVERAYFASPFDGTQSSMAVGVFGSWSHCVPSEEADRSKCWCLTHFLLFIQFGTSGHGTVLPTRKGLFN